MTETKLERKTLREWREGEGLTLAELAELAGCSFHTVSATEHGARPIGTPTGKKILAALEIKPEQVALPNAIHNVSFNWAEDGFANSAPRRDLKSWREIRGMTQMELCVLSGIPYPTISRIERAGDDGREVRLKTRRKLAEALRVAPHKLNLPGGDIVEREERADERVLRAELRAKTRLLRRWWDVSQDPSIFGHRAQDATQSLVRDTARELEGT